MLLLWLGMETMVSLGLTKSSSAELYTSGPEVHIQRAHRKFFKWLNKWEGELL